MEEILRITALCTTGAILALILKRGSLEFSLLVTLAVIVVAFYAVLEPLNEILGFLQELGVHAGVHQALYTPLYKTVGIACVVKVGSSLCYDAGESALGAVIELTGTICSFFVSLPLMRTVLSMLLELMK